MCRRVEPRRDEQEQKRGRCARVKCETETRASSECIGVETLVLKTRTEKDRERKMERGMKRG